MTTCALVGAVDFNAEHFMQQHFDCVIAVDRGFSHLQTCGCMPTIAVGDFDSLGYVPDAPNVHVHPAEKDESDMELACRLGLEQADTLVLYGCLAQRLDHTIANLQLMLGIGRTGARVLGVGDTFALAVLHGTPDAPGRIAFDAFSPSTLTGPYAPFISVFAIGGTAHGVTETGLKYAFNHEDVPDSISRGLSNEFTGNAAAIEVSAGDLLVVFPLDAWPSLRFSFPSGNNG